jgi:hypothetical protein
MPKSAIRGALAMLRKAKSKAFFLNSVPPDSLLSMRSCNPSKVICVHRSQRFTKNKKNTGQYSRKNSTKDKVVAPSAAKRANGCALSSARRSPPCFCSIFATALKAFFYFFFFYFFQMWFSAQGVCMAGFVSVPSARGAGVVARSLSCGWVWARRALPDGAGWSPAPACLFVPFVSQRSAVAFARVVASFGWRCWVRSGSVGSPVFAACKLPVPAFCVKVALPVGWSASAARVALAGVCVHA